MAGAAALRGLRAQHRPQADAQRFRLRQGGGPIPRKRTIATGGQGLDRRRPGNSCTHLGQRIGKSVPQGPARTALRGHLQCTLAAQARLHAQCHHGENEGQIPFDGAAALFPQAA
ncbi:hypothetical protein G6F35_018524 [Rhizopus arrhizus]|nr:hypothetical protein G6F35_018524 [Rhizopus arrhizus]